MHPDHTADGERRKSTAPASPGKIKANIISADVVMAAMREYQQQGTCTQSNNKRVRYLLLWCVCVCVLIAESDMVGPSSTATVRTMHSEWCEGYLRRLESKFDDIAIYSIAPLQPVISKMRSGHALEQADVNRLYHSTCASDVLVSYEQWGIVHVVHLVVM